MLAVVLLTGFAGGIAGADPTPTPDPSPPSAEIPAPAPAEPPAIAPAPASEQTSLTLSLSTSRGVPGSQFTATASDGHACDVRGLAGAIDFRWRFDEQIVSTGSASATFTVPESATPDTYQVSATCASFRSVITTATFTVEETPVLPPSLSLQPQQGTAERTSVTATTTGLDACRGSNAGPRTSWQWDGQPLTTSAGADGSTVTFDVPATAAGTYSVTATCGSSTATAPFTVVAAVAPTLTLDRPRGPRGSHVTASGTGFACGDDRVTVLWDGDIALGDAPTDTFSIPLNLPDGAAVSRHTVTAKCRNHPDVADTQTFTVTDDTGAAGAAASVNLTPPAGAAGTIVQLSGEGFLCTDTRMVQLSWDGQPLGTATADPSGHLDASITIPADADAKSYTVRAACEAGWASATAGFTILATGTLPSTTTGPVPPPPPPPADNNSGAIIAVVLLLVAIIVGVSAARAHRRRQEQEKQGQEKPPDPSRVRATVSATSASPVVSATDTPADGEVSHALRLFVHADVGTQTISEVNSDHTTA